MRKRTIKPLPELQKQTLLEMYRNHPKSRMRERAHMALLSCIAGIEVRHFGGEIM